MEFDAVFTVKKETSKEEFLRKLLIELASSSKTPTDVVNAKFGEVEESVREAIVCSAHVEMDYSASIGYDRVETYWTKEKRYNSSTKQYYYVDVEKTRTVTDWQPFSSHISGDKTAAAFNESYSGIYDNDIIIIKQQSVANNGEIVVALIDDSATVKRFYKKNGKIILHPENDSMSDMIFDDVIILGVVKGLMRKF